uniref:Uncharacterized protein n=1 Tax=Xenopus tropicalis TaxID=8364 RepID=A0A6I8Q5M8_XENTR
MKGYCYTRLIFGLRADTVIFWGPLVLCVLMLQGSHADSKHGGRPKNILCVLGYCILPLKEKERQLQATSGDLLSCQWDGIAGRLVTHGNKDFVISWMVLTFNTMS